MEKRMRVGMIGAGRNAEGHMRACLKTDVAIPVAVCDPAVERAEECAAKYGIEQVYSSYEELLEKSDVDAVVVSVPNFVHHSASIAALDAGKHVLCEKPMSIRLDWAEEMLAAERRSGKLLQIGMTSRHRPETHWLKAAIDNGDFGRIYFARAHYIRRSGIPRFGGWFTTKKLSGGGPLIDIGVHVLDQTWYLLGNPKPLSVFGVAHSEMGHRKIGVSTWAGKEGEGHFDVEDHASALIRFAGGASISLEVSWAAFTQPARSIQFMGTEQGALVADGKVTLMTEKAGEDVDRTEALQPEGGPNPFELQMAAFVKAARGEGPCVAPADQGLAVTKMLLGIYESAQLGREVQL